MNILIMGLPGAGKTTLAEALQKRLNASWHNADEIRARFNDMDFSIDGRLRSEGASCRERVSSPV